MPEKIKGRLTSIRLLPGWIQDLKLVVNNEIFYFANSRRMPELGNYIGKQIELEYSEVRMNLITRVFDKVLLASSGLPREYNDVESIRLLG